MINDFHVRIVVETSPWRYYHEIQTDVVDNTIVDPAFPAVSVRDFMIESIAPTVPTCVGNSPSDLKIRTNIGSVIVDDDYAVTADASDKKWVKIALVRDDTSGLLELLAFEKVLGNYANIPAGKTLEFDLKEFSVVASGSVLVEEESWI